MKLLEEMDQGRRNEANHTAEKNVPSPGQVDNGRLNVMWCANLDHGGIFDLVASRMRLKGEITMRAREGSNWCRREFGA